MTLCRAAGEVIRSELAGGHADLPSEVRDGVIGHLV